VAAPSTRSTTLVRVRNAHEARAERPVRRRRGFLERTVGGCVDLTDDDVPAENAKRRRRAPSFLVESWIRPISGSDR
jgi:hypothetical protein